MNLKANTASSHQQLVARLIKQRKKKTWFLSWDHKHLLIHAFKTAVAATSCYCMARAVHFHDGYWAAISAVIVMQSNFGATMKASRDRFIGDADRRGSGFFFFRGGSSSVEFCRSHSHGGDSLRASGAAQQLSPGRSDDLRGDAD